jgi:ATP synthase F1 delta subunit
MIKVSRRILARYAADRLLAGDSSKKLGDELVAVLNQQKMLGQTEQLTNDINYELEQRQELAVSRAASARPLSAETITEIERAIKQATGVKQVSLDTEVDKSLIGGLRVETAAQVWDETIKQKLANLRGVA